jgi:hypothetical protein
MISKKKMETSITTIVTFIKLHALGQFQWRVVPPATVEVAARTTSSVTDHIGAGAIGIERATDR